MNERYDHPPMRTGKTEPMLGRLLDGVLREMESRGLTLVQLHGPVADTLIHLVARCQSRERETIIRVSMAKLFRFDLLRPTEGEEGFTDGGGV